MWVKETSESAASVVTRPHVAGTFSSTLHFYLVCVSTCSCKGFGNVMMSDAQGQSVQSLPSIDGLPSICRRRDWDSRHTQHH